MSPLGEEEIVQVTPSPKAKFEPEMRTFVPERPEVGRSEIPGVTMKLAVPMSSVVPLTVTV
jgi:hypothetical protein